MFIPCPPDFASCRVSASEKAHGAFAHGTDALAFWFPVPPLLLTAPSALPSCLAPFEHTKYYPAPALYPQEAAVCTFLSFSWLRFGRLFFLAKVTRAGA